MILSLFQVIRSLTSVSPSLFTFLIQTVNVKRGTKYRKAVRFKRGFNDKYIYAIIACLLTDPEVAGLLSTIGGMNSSSMIPFLDFERIRQERKSICGFSDVTSLHMAILKFSGLRTVYGPSVMCRFGDWPHGIPESSE